MVRLRTAEVVETQQQFRQLMEQSPLSIQVLDPSGRITYVNRAWMKIWGIDQDALPEVLASYNMLEDKQLKELGMMPLVKKVFEGESVVLPELEYDADRTMVAIGVETGANKIWVSSTFYTVKNDQGELISVVNVEQDVSERKLIEDQLHSYHDRLRALAAELTITEEMERRRIAAELHDGPAQSLAFARMQLASEINALAGTTASAKLEEVSQLVKESLQQIREVLLDLSSPVLNEIGLAAALSEWLKEQAGQRYGLQTAFEDRTGTVSLSENVRTLLYRNARELIMNAVKHAKAERLSVGMATLEGSLCITVEDDGIGFIPEAVAQRSPSEGSFGLFSIRERMTDLGGSLTIDSSPGKGCKATLIIPLSSTA
jgi:signal transduction histidine kinase